MSSSSSPLAAVVALAVLVITTGHPATSSEPSPPLHAAGDPGGRAVVATCVPDTLGSDSFRASQTWELELGRIVQPGVGWCLTVSNLSTVQGAPAIELQPCADSSPQAAELAKNQTWTLAATGQIALTDGGGQGKGTPGLPGPGCGLADCCIDVPGYSTTPGTALHLWSCTVVPASPPPPLPCSTGPLSPCRTMSNQQFSWEAFGAVVGLQSGLCLDAGGSGGGLHTCDVAPWNATAFCDRALSPEQRATALVANISGNLTTMIANLGIGAAAPAGFKAQGVTPPTFHEALHGVCCGPGSAHTAADGYTSTGVATSFPHALAMSATFNRSLWGLVGEVVGIESRALRNQNGEACRGPFFTPNVNLYRDPRWGRGMEVPGEDPLVAGEYGREFVHAMQARNGTTQRAMCMPKHWLAYDIEGRRGDPAGFDRSSFDAVVSKQQMLEYYLPAFHATVRSGQASGVMCSTNSVNGVDACMDPLYLKGWLRGRFNFTGAVVTDGDSCGNPNCAKTVAALHPQCAGCTSINAANQSAQCPAVCGALGAKLCLEAGTDIELGTTLLDWSADAVAENLLQRSTVIGANVHLYSNLIRAGLYDADPANDALGAKDVDTRRSRQLALEAATDAMVLLKNDRALLPLNRSSGKPIRAALIGPHLNSTVDLLSSLAYTEDRTRGPPFATIEAAFRRREAAAGFHVVGAALGCDIVAGCPTADTAGVTAAVKDADVVIAFVGLHPASGAPSYPGYGTVCAESEAQDRLNISLCGEQQAVLEAAMSGGAPLVVVMINGGTIDLSWVSEHADAVLNAWYPGEWGGEAVASVVFGDRHPTGRLPVTIYPSSVVDTRVIGDMDLRSARGLSYMHYRGHPVYPFGYGLSYTTWRTELPTTSLTTTTSALVADYVAYYSPGAAGAPFFDASTSLPVVVTNTDGPRHLGGGGSSVVVQVFATLSTPSAAAMAGGTLAPPLRQLVGFERSPGIGAGGARTIKVSLTPLALTRVDADGNQWIEAGTWTLSATVDGTSFLNATLAVTGPRRQVMAWPDPSEYRSS